MNWFSHIASLSNPVELASYFVDHLFTKNIQFLTIDVLLILTIHGLYIYLLTRLLSRFIEKTSTKMTFKLNLVMYFLMILLVILSHVGDIFILTWVLESFKVFPDPLITFHYVSGMYTTIGSDYNAGPDWQGLSMLISFTGLFAFSISGSGLYSMLGYFVQKK